MEPVIAGDGMKVISHNLHVAILASQAVGKKACGESECKSLTARPGDLLGRHIQVPH